MRTRSLISTAAISHACRPRCVLAAVPGTEWWDDCMARVGTEVRNVHGEMVLIDGVINPAEKPVAGTKRRVYRPGDAPLG